MNENDESVLDYCNTCLWLNNSEEPKRLCDHYYNDFAYNITEDFVKKVCRPLLMKESI